VRTSLFWAAIAVAFAVATPAAAKEPISATVCGASGCKTITDRQQLREIPGGESTVPLGRVAPYYRIEVLVGERAGATHSFVTYYVPSANAMAWSERGLVAFHPIYGEHANEAMRKLVAGIRPFRLPRVSSVRVGDRRVIGLAAQTYLGLFAQTSEAPLAESPDDWVNVELRSPPGAGSPWTDGRPDLSYSPGAKLLERSGLRFELPSEFATDLEAGRALDPSSDGGDRRRWALGLGLVAAIALGSLVRVARRR
jgi:hypothetical protein